MRTALYLRLSDEDKLKVDNLSESIKNQEIMLKDYAKEKGYEVVSIYNDEDWSGSDDTRPGFNKMLEECRKGNIDIVLCKTQSRFARDMELIEKYIHNLFHQWNVRFVTVVDRIDNMQKESRKTSQILSLTDQWYLEDTSINIRETFRAKRKEGKLTASFASYGYIKEPSNKNHLIVDKIASSIVKRIFNEYISGVGVEKIAYNLNNDNILSPYEYKLLNGSKLKIPLVKNYLNYEYIKSIGTYIVDINFTNNEDGVLYNFSCLNTINFDGKGEITIKKCSQGNLYCVVDGKLKRLNIDDTINCIDYIIFKTDKIINNHNINYQFEISLKENKAHKKYYIKVTNENIKNSNFICNIRKKFKWSSASIKKILKDEVYIGNLVQFKTTTVSYKNHTLIYNDETERIRKNNTHEPIIDKNIWHQVQERLKNKTRSLKSGKIHTFSNKVYCMNCNQTFKKCGKNNEQGFSYLCCKDKINKWNYCDNKKYINEEVLYNFVLNKINELLTKYYDEDYINELYKKDILKEQNKELIEIENEIDFINNKLNKKDLYFKKLYDDYNNGIIEKREFSILISNYRDDYEKLKNRIKTLENSRDNNNSLKQFDSSLYKKIDNLSIDLVDTFISKILIGKYNNNSRNLKIIWNF